MGMDQEQRRQQHLKANNASLTTRRPTKENMVNGEERYFILNGTLRHYIKQQGQLYYRDFTKE